MNFRNEFYKNDTELSKELWQIKIKNCTMEITCRITLGAETFASRNFREIKKSRNI